MEYEIGVFEAKTHFSQVMDSVQKGADYTVTRRGKPVAKIIPIMEETEMTIKEALDEFKELRKLYRSKPASFDVRAAIEEGRR